LVWVSANGSETRLNQFAAPIELTFNYDSETLDEQLLGIYYLNEQTDKWEFVHGEIVEPGMMKARVSHFSVYALKEYFQNFEDVSTEHWAYRTIQLLTAKHMISGFSDHEFRPNGIVTRAEFSAMLVRALGLSTSAEDLSDMPFSDIAKGTWYADY